MARAKMTLVERTREDARAKVIAEVLDLLKPSVDMNAGMNVAADLTPVLHAAAKLDFLAERRGRVKAMRDAAVRLLRHDGLAHTDCEEYRREGRDGAADSLIKWADELEAGKSWPLDPKPTPMVAFGTGELERAPRVVPNEMIDCPHGCGERHIVVDSTPPGILQAYRCGDKTYLIGVHGRRVR